MNTTDQVIAALRYMMQSDVERNYHEGRLSQDAYEGYMHAWATSAVRLSSVADGWRSHGPITPEAERIARALGCCRAGVVVS